MARPTDGEFVTVLRCIAQGSNRTHLFLWDASVKIIPMAISPRAETEQTPYSPTDSLLVVNAESGM